MSHIHMFVNGVHYRTVWMKDTSVFMIDQTLLPFTFCVYEAKCYQDVCAAIKNMVVRGAGAIGVTGGFGMALAYGEAPEHGFWDFVGHAKQELENTRPTAQNLFYALNRVHQAAQASIHPKETAIREAQLIANEDAESCRRIGVVGEECLHHGKKVLTHCNAGWLAFVDYGTALSPIYVAQRKGSDLFVWVDETRPRGQGARLTAWELYQAGIHHKIISDNAAASLMAQKMVDLVIVGADRIARNGDVANKIGTLEKAICAKEFGIPFYVAAPISTIDSYCPSGHDIPIETRSQNEILYQTGFTTDGKLETIAVGSPGSEAYNPAFDVTPAKYITGIITEAGIIQPKHIEKILR